jgi:hypothetical protein
LTEPPSGKAAIGVRPAPNQGPKPPVSNWTRFNSLRSVIFYRTASNELLGADILQWKPMNVMPYHPQGEFSKTDGNGEELTGASN